MNKMIKKTGISIVIIFIGIIGTLFFSDYSLMAGDGDKAQKNSDESQNETSPLIPLIPVVIGGLIGVGGGAVVFLLQSRNEHKVFKRAKF